MPNPGKMGPLPRTAEIPADRVFTTHMTSVCGKESLFIYLFTLFNVGLQNS